MLPFKFQELAWNINLDQSHAQVPCFFPGATCGLMGPLRKLRKMRPSHQQRKLTQPFLRHKHKQFPGTSSLRGGWSCQTSADPNSGSEYLKKAISKDSGYCDHIFWARGKEAWNCTCPGKPGIIFLQGRPEFDHREEGKRDTLPLCTGHWGRGERGAKKVPAYLKIKVASDVCDLCEETYKAVIFRKMKGDEQKEWPAMFLDGQTVYYKMAIFSS